jgi:N-[(2S)-2-amino-2-carboxyethyl]-L-glutamate dehydrogenase
MAKPSPAFSVVSGAQVDQVLSGREKQIMDVVERAYVTHGAGHTVNPPSYFLRFPDRPDSRIIALPASLGAEDGVDGIKWISSFPSNIETGLPRASAVLILNDPRTGYPYACLESSIISATRTAASAALAADWLSRGAARPTRVGFLGTGLIARYIHRFLAGTGWSFDEVGLFDAVPDYTAGFGGYLRTADESGRLTVHASAAELIRASDLVVFATTAATPHVTDPALFAHHPLVLHVSLRDLGPEVILSATNIVDDVEHCLKANTSPHLAEQRTGNRDFLSGTLPEVIGGTVAVDLGRPVVFSPFGLGVLDLAVGRYVYDELSRAGDLTVVDDFFFELRRHG